MPRKNGQYIKCMYCGTYFYVAKYNLKTAKYCSRKCSDNSRKGKPHWNKGIPRSEETKRKLSESHKEQVPWNTGLQHPKETRDKISKSLFGRYRSSESPNWKGGFKRKKYKTICIKDHPSCKKMGYVYEHRYIMEQHIGRYIKPKEVVHHINKNPLDNRIENLMLFKNNSDHLKYHKYLKLKVQHHEQ